MSKSKQSKKRKKKYINRNYEQVDAIRTLKALRKILERRGFFK